MTNVFALIEGKADLADILFLVAFIVFVIGAVIAAMGRNIEGLVLLAGLACVALAWLVL